MWIDFYVEIVLGICDACEYRCGDNAVGKAAGDGCIGEAGGQHRGKYFKRLRAQTLSGIKEAWPACWEDMENSIGEFSAVLLKVKKLSCGQPLPAAYGVAWPDQREARPPRISWMPRNLLVIPTIFSSQPLAPTLTQ